MVVREKESKGDEMMIARPRYAVPVADRSHCWMAGWRVRLGCCIADLREASSMGPEYLLRLHTPLPCLLLLCAIVCSHSELMMQQTYFWGFLVVVLRGFFLHFTTPPPPVLDRFVWATRSKNFRSKSASSFLLLSICSPVRFSSSPTLLRNTCCNHGDKNHV